MIIRQFFIPGIAHCSYLLGAASSCVIIDPARDPAPYVKAAEEEGFLINGILLTHLHADFVSGHLDLHSCTEAPIYAPKSADCRFPHNPVHEGTQITLDDCSIEVLETPGHTPEHVSYVVTHRSRGNEPVAVFPGDTLFVGDVGRPDLFPGRSRELSAALYSSLHDKLLHLPDHCEVYPAHGAGSFCGRALSAKRSTTIGYERRYNPALQIPDKESFIKKLTENMPPSPDHFSRCSAINRDGPTLISELKKPLYLKPNQVKTRYESEEVCILDVRSYGEFGSMHVPGSLNVDSEVNFSTFAGWIVPPDRDIILVTHHPDQVYQVCNMLWRVGIDRVSGVLKGGMQSWALSGLRQGHIPVISVHDLKEMLDRDEELQILDVRTADEHAGYHIPGAIHIHWPDIRTEYDKLEKERPVAVLCGTGVRSGTACSMLKQKGFSLIYNVAGGYTAWITVGFHEKL